MWLILLVFGLSFVFDYVYRSFTASDAKEVEKFSGHQKYAEDINSIDIDAAQVAKDGSKNVHLSQDEYLQKATTTDEYSHPSVEVLYCIG